MLAKPILERKECLRYVRVLVEAEMAAHTTNRAATRTLRGGGVYIHVMPDFFSN